MKNLKNILASILLVTVIGVSTSFGGVYYADKTNDPKSTANVPCSVKDDGEVVNNGILIAGFSGILIAGLTGILIAGLASDAPSCDGITNEGILIAG